MCTVAASPTRIATQPEPRRVPFGPLFPAVSVMGPKPAFLVAGSSRLSPIEERS